MTTPIETEQSELAPVRRRLRLEDLNQLQIALLAKEFSAEPGVVKAVVRKQWLEIEYDVAVLTLERVIALIEAYGGDLSADWWNTLKANWYMRREEKLRSQLTDTDDTDEPPI